MIANELVSLNSAIFTLYFKHKYLLKKVDIYTQTSIETRCFRYILNIKIIKTIQIKYLI